MQSRRSLRLEGYDYRRQGVYFVTVCANRNAKLFGRIDDGVMIRNAIGDIINDEWWKTAELRPNVKLDAFVIMPNHIHGIIVISDDGSQATSQHASVDVPKPASRYLQSGSLGAIVGRFKGKVSRRVHDLPTCRDLLVWQRNFYDHIIRNEKSLQAIREYIMTNPGRWTEDSYYTN